MAEGRHRKQGKRSPPGRPDEGPPGGLTWRRLAYFLINLAFALLIALLVKGADWLITWWVATLI